MYPSPVLSRALAALVAAGALVPSAAPAADGAPLTLAEAVSEAMAHNPDLEAARAAPLLAESAVRSARAPFDALLYLDARDGFTRAHVTATSDLEEVEDVDEEGSGATLGVARTLAVGTALDLSLTASRQLSNVAYATFNPALSSTLALTVTQPLLDGAGRVNRAGIDVAAAQEAAAEEAWRAQALDLVLATCQSYWELSFRQGDLVVKAQAVALAADQLERNREQVRLGSLAPVELIQAEQALASAELAHIQAELALDRAWQTLRGLMGMGDAAPVSRREAADVPANVAAPVDVEAAVALAKERAPEVRQARHLLAGREVEMRAAANRRLPQLDVLGGVALTGIGGTPVERTVDGGPIGASAMAGQIVTADNYRWGVGVQLSVPLRNYQDGAALDQARIRHAQAEAQVEAEANTAEGAVRQAARTVAGQGAITQAAQRARELAERQLEAEEDKFVMGTATNFQVLQYQRELAEARTAELRARADLEIARASLERAQGTLGEAVGASTDP